MIPLSIYTYLWWRLTVHRTYWFCLRDCCTNFLTLIELAQRFEPEVQIACTAEFTARVRCTRVVAEKTLHRLWGRRNSICKTRFTPASYYKPKLVVTNKTYHITVTVNVCVRRMDKWLKGLMRKHYRRGRVIACVGCGEVSMYAHGSKNERTRTLLK
jgi:hypothetical protein